MKTFTNPNYLRQQQYKTPYNLNARVSLHRRFSTNPYPWHHWVFDQIQAPSGARIFEIGCGPGYLWPENRERIPESWVICLADLSTGMVRTAQAALSGGRFAFLAADAQKIPMAAHQFDAVIANHMLFHIPDLPAALAGIRRILNRGGKPYASAVGFRNLFEIWEWAAEALPERKSIMLAREAVVGFSLENGEEQLSRYFSNVELIRYSDSLVIDQVRPVVDFVVSSPYTGDLSSDELRRYKSFLEAELKAKGALKVTKDAGIFVAE